MMPPFPVFIYYELSSGRVCIKDWGKSLLALTSKPYSWYFSSITALNIRIISLWTLQQNCRHTCSCWYVWFFLDCPEGGHYFCLWRWKRWQFVFCRQGNCLHSSGKEAKSTGLETNLIVTFLRVGLPVVFSVFACNTNIEWDKS